MRSYSDFSNLEGIGHQHGRRAKTGVYRFGAHDGSGTSRPYTARRLVDSVVRFEGDLGVGSGCRMSIPAKELRCWVFGWLRGFVQRKGFELEVE